MPFWQHFVGADTALREHGAVGLGLFQRVLPLALQGRQQALRFAKVEGNLRRLVFWVTLSSHECSLDKRLVDTGIVLRQGHHHTQFLLDGFALAQDDLQHKTVDGVVLPVEHGAAYLGRLLTKAVHPAFPLLVSRGVPGKVILNDGREQVLQVDTL